MNLFRRISEWSKYERLNHYPALKAFDRDAALKRLDAYEREEREACKYWLRTVWILIILFTCGLMTAMFLDVPIRGAAVLMLPAWILQYFLHRRIKRRVEAKVAAELRDGRLWTCVECGYDLRASQERCPECGASIHVTPIS